LKEPLHILYLSSWYPNRKDPTLGIFVKRHAEAAAEINKVTLLHACVDTDMGEGEFRIEKTEKGQFRELLVSYGASHSKIGFIRRLKNYQYKKRFYHFGLEKVLEWAGQVDLIHLHVPWPMGEIMQSLSRKLKVPYVLSEHWTGYQPEDGRYKGWLMERLTKRTARDAAFVLPVSEHLLQAMRSKGVPGNYRVVPNVVDTDLFKPLEGEQVIEKHLIHVSSLDDQQKDVSGIIAAFIEARKQAPELKLVVIGSGIDEVKLKKLSNEAGLTGRSVFFKGRMMEHDLVKEFQHARAFVLNSRFETQGVVILEALACGIPVIAPAIGGIDPQIRDGCGILFPSGDQKALCEAMLEVANNYQQYEAEKIREFVNSRFSYQVVSKQLDQIYREVLQR
jgi:glycosyltransferase involved in cell wall biosynthesis